MRIIDGAANFGAELETVYRTHPLFIDLAQRAGVTVPPLDVVADTSALPVRINHNRLIADCPDCGGAAYVWRAGPHLQLCPDCWNGIVGGRWRRVALPDDLPAIEAALTARALPANRNWEVGETVADLLRQTAENGG